MASTAEPAKPDPFTLEILKSRLLVVAEEMFITQGRTSKSPIIYEVLDYACAITDARAQLIAQANGVAGFLGALTFAVEDVLEKFGESGLDPGDIVATNIPYQGGGSHLSDVTMVLPLFFAGSCVAFAVNKAHWTEVGGKDPGSMTNDSVDIYQEGVQLPCIKLFERGEPVASVIDLLAANVRTPESTLGDLYAQAAALRIGQRRVSELVSDYGADLVHLAMEAILDEGELRARTALEALPEGTYFAEDEVEDDGMGTGPTPVQAAITITGDTFTVDFTGTGPSAKGSINCTRASLMAGMRIMFTAIVAPRLAANEGMFRPLRVICPEGTIFTARRPAPTSTYWETRLVASDAVWKALAPVLPEQLTAGHYRSVCAEVIRTRHPETGELALLVEPNPGGWGAGADKDGESGLFSMGNGETFVLSAEVAETRYDVQVQRFGFDVLPGGEGRFRGGRGLVREYLMRSEGSVTASFGRSAEGGWPVAGGRCGTPNYVEIRFADCRPPTRAGKVTRVPLARGDLIRLVTGTGGGWGDPRARPREQIVQDLRTGMISEAAARSVYGLEGELQP
ncbi:MAG: hydantoinase B/oxoprolinase family protein [Truepera sp.]|nr:hydantoinase B/oxoprolinase family protein [Truepera sp.]